MLKTCVLFCRVMGWVLIRLHLSRSQIQKTSRAGFKEKSKGGRKVRGEREEDRREEIHLEIKIVKETRNNTTKASEEKRHLNYEEAPVKEPV